MNRKSLPLCMALCLSILASAHAAQADPGQQMSDRIEQMKLDGWQEVAPGVLQRTIGTRVETFAYGEQGMRWSAERLKERAGLLKEEYNRYPSEDLAQVIESLELQIGERESSLQTTASDSFGGGETTDACTIMYDATADAYGLTGSSAPGAGASAYARWYSDCNHVGYTYAYAYARATTPSGTQTIQIKEDPQAGLIRSGTNISSSGTVSAPGDRDCFSEAYGRSWNPNLNIDYSSYDSNYSCPNPPPTLYVNSVSADKGSVYLDNYYYCDTVTYTANVSGGVPGYSYSWYVGGYYAGSGNPFSYQYCGPHGYPTTYNVQVNVSDSSGQSKSGSTTTYVYWYQDSCTSGCCMSTASGEGTSALPPCY